MTININSPQNKPDDFEEEFSGQKGTGKNKNEQPEPNTSNHGENARINQSGNSQNKAASQNVDQPNNTSPETARQSQGSTVSLNTAANNVEVSVELDVLENSPSPSETKRQISTEAEKPSLPEADPAQKNVQETVKEAQNSNQLPKTEDLFKLLPEETRKLLESLFDSSEGGKVNPKKFFDMLSKMIPLSMTLIQGNGKSGSGISTDLSETLASMINEMEAILQKHGDSASLSIENKNLLENLANQLKLIGMEKGLPNSFEPLSKELAALLAQESGKSVDVSSRQELIRQLVDAQALPTSYLSDASIPVKSLEKALEIIRQAGTASALRSGAASPHPTVQTMVQMSQIFNTVQAFPAEQRAKVIQLMMRTQGLFSTDTSLGFLGASTQKFSQSISNFLIGLTQGIGLIPSDKTVTDAGSQYLSRVFGELILAGAILGRLVIDKGDGKAMELNDALQVGQAHMRATRDLGIIDLVPFSFLAFFAPFEQMGGGKSKAEREAVDALMKFIRTFMSLLFMLVAIYTGGKKIGEHGVDLMLEANADYLRGNLDNLIFCLKKLDELYGVSVQQPIQRCGRAKIALDQEDYEEFWDHIFGFLTEKSALFSFLEEVDQLDSLYESIHALLKESGMEHLSLLRM